MSDETGHERPDSSKKNNSAAVDVSSFLTECATPFFVYKIIVTEKIALKCLFVCKICKIKMIGMLLLYVNVVRHQVQNRKQKHVTERYSRLYNHSTLLCFSQTRETLKLKKLPSQLCYSLPSIIITITSNKPWNIETQWNPPITDHKPWPFEPI